MPFPGVVGGGVVVGGAWAPTFAVTVACWLVANVVIARPLALVVTRAADNVPAVVEKLTGAESRALPLMSKTSDTSMHTYFHDARAGGL